MKRVTRNIDPSCAQDLLARVPRACLCFACDQGPQAQPIVLVWQEGCYLAGIPEQTERQPGEGSEVVLLIDEGVHLCWLLGTSVHKIGKLRRDNLSSFHIAFTKRCTAKQCEIKQSSAS
jgi:hypothetical protein